MRKMWVGEYKNNSLYKNKSLFVPGVYFCILIMYVL